MIIAALLGIGMQAVMALTSDVLRVFNDIPALVGYTALALLLMKIPFILQAGMWLSNISYEYYLVHMLVITTMFHLIQPRGLLLQGFVGLVAMVVSVVMAKTVKWCVSRRVMFVR